VIEKFRKIATNHDVHISLVIHPRKIDENEDLSLSSVFGSAKAT
jgi:twinkle protein